MTSDRGANSGEAEVPVTCDAPLRSDLYSTSRPATRRKGLTNLRDSGVSPEIEALLTSNCGRWNCSSLRLLPVPRGEDMIWFDGNAGGGSYTASVGMGRVP